MWRTDGGKAYPFRNKHTNHFLPVPPSEKDSDHLSLHMPEYRSDEEVPIVLMIPEYHPESHNRSFFSSSTLDIVLTAPTPTERKHRHQTLTSVPLPKWPFVTEMPSVTEYFTSDYIDSEDDVSTPPVPLRRRPSLNLKPLSIPPRGPLPPLPITPRSARFSSNSNTPTTTTSTPKRSRHQQAISPPTTASLAPEKMTNLLTEVLNIMNSIMNQKQSIAEDASVLGDLAELVVIMQEEAEGLLHLAGLVEEFVEEVDTMKEAAEIEAWVAEMGLDDLPEISDASSGETTETESNTTTPVNTKVDTQGKLSNHARDYSVDSALGLDDGPSGHVRDVSETIHQAAIIQIAQLRKTESEIRRGNLIEIGRRAMERSLESGSMPTPPRTPRTPKTPRTPQTPRTPRTPFTPRAQYASHRKPSPGEIYLVKEPRDEKGRKQVPPPLLAFRDSALAISPSSTLGFQAKKSKESVKVLSPRWI
ncbi:hypothetical protein VTL71DRAFT_5960 [Oculimacula yallundae]|uniref:Uncharacterized protein n=1 Tax=Oculimacula yallundae TaxID=86028 RepID=A0ABR4C1K0_9HELO